MLKKPWYQKGPWARRSTLARESARRARQKESPKRFLPLSLAGETADGAFKILTLLFLSLATVVTITLTGESQDLRSSAAGRTGGRIFCQGKRLCEDQHCEGESWATCDDCPPGRAKIITQIRCGVYQETGCVYDQFTSCAEL